MTKLRRLVPLFVLVALVVVLVVTIALARGGTVKVQIRRQ